MAINFHSEEIPFDLEQKNLHKRWLKRVLGTYGKKPGTLQFVFTSNAYLLRMNTEYLNHKHYTDVITFDYTEGNIVSGDVFISTEQVNINADFYRVKKDEELRRVMVHGVLHLVGFNDASEEERLVMREKENEALHLWLKEE